MFLCGSLGIVLPFLFLSQENSEPEQFNFNLWKTKLSEPNTVQRQFWGGGKSTLQSLLSVARISAFLFKHSKIHLQALLLRGFCSFVLQSENPKSVSCFCVAVIVFYVKYLEGPQWGLRKQLLPLDLSSWRRFVLKLIISGATQVSHICPELKTDSH